MAYYSRALACRTFSLSHWLQICFIVITRRCRSVVREARSAEIILPSSAVERLLRSLSSLPTLQGGRAVARVAKHKVQQGLSRDSRQGKQQANSCRVSSIRACMRAARCVWIELLVKLPERAPSTRVPGEYRATTVPALSAGWMDVEKTSEAGREMPSGFQIIVESKHSK